MWCSGYGGDSNQATQFRPNYSGRTKFSGLNQHLPCRVANQALRVRIPLRNTATVTIFILLFKRKSNPSKIKRRYKGDIKSEIPSRPTFPNSIQRFPKSIKYRAIKNFGSYVQVQQRVAIKPK